MNTAPGYDWTCHRCSEPNAAGTAICKKCEMPAIASANDLPPALKTVKENEPAPDQPSFVIFFPEIIPAAICVLASPFWSASLASAGYYLAALCTLLVAATGVYGFVLCLRRGHRWYADFVLAAILLGMVGINSSLPNGLAIF